MSLRLTLLESRGQKRVEEERREAEREAMRALTRDTNHSTAWFMVLLRARGYGEWHDILVCLVCSLIITLVVGMSSAADILLQRESDRERICVDYWETAMNWGTPENEPLGKER